MATSLPPNFRFLLTSRPSPDIQRVLLKACHVISISLDNVHAENDICMYVRRELEDVEDIGEVDLREIAMKAGGLFEWAGLASEFIRAGMDKGGLTTKERLNKVMLAGEREQETLLDNMYHQILDGTIDRSHARSLDQFHSVMLLVLTVKRPLPMDALNVLHHHIPNQEDHYDVKVILRAMASLLSGVIENIVLVRPLHTSFYDFLTDPDQSRDYLVGKGNMETNLAFTSLAILDEGLCFNICKLENSYLLYSEVVGLQEKVKENIPDHLAYSCQFWARHLREAGFDVALAMQVKSMGGSEKILFWMEACSFLKELGNVAADLASAAEWLQNKEGFEDVVELTKDGVEFVHTFSNAISYRTPHLYISGVPFLPTKSPLFKMVRQRFCGMAKVAIGYMENWPHVQMQLKGHTDWVNSIAFCPSGKRIASGSADMTVRIWNVDSGAQIGSPLQGHTSRVRSVAFSPDGTRIVSGSDDNTVRVWDADNGVESGSPLQGHTDWVTSVAFSSDGTRIISGSYDKTVRVWDADSGVQIGSPLQGYTDAVTSVAFSPDGTRIVSSSDDKTWRVWDADSGVQVGSPLQGHTFWDRSVAFCLMAQGLSQVQMTTL
ncbi:hypothetical protein ID866_10121 [Astraeus odoratus]|nr:hypothetical protein ID866_10121 [Astraeus odoratus]